LGIVTHYCGRLKKQKSSVFFDYFLKNGVVSAQSPDIPAMRKKGTAQFAPRQITSRTASGYTLRTFFLNV